MNTKIIKFWNWFAVFYIILSLLFLTLIPFDFKWLAAAQQPIWEFNVEDVAQNLFLFFPLGVVLKHTMQRNIVAVVLCGAILSTIIELIQLSDIGRTSSYSDILTNTLGTLLGCLYYRYLVFIPNKDSLNIAFVFALMPLCWFLSMRSATQEFMAWLVLPLALVALSVFKSNLYNNQLKWLTLIIWLVFSLIPLIYISQNMALISLLNFNLTPGIIIFIFVPLVVGTFPIFKEIDYVFCLRLILITTILIMTINLAWYLRKSSPISWTVPAHLHWIETLMSFMAIIIAIAWAKSVRRNS